MAFADQWTNGQSPVFVERVQIGITNAAINITSEGSGVTNHANRSALAKQVLLNPAAFAPQFAWAVAANLVMDTPNAATDTQISNAIGGIWNAFAGGL